MTHDEGREQVSKLIEAAKQARAMADLDLEIAALRSRLTALEASLAAEKADKAKLRDVAPLIEAIQRLLITAGVGSCECGIKTPDVEWHRPNCRYVHIQYALENAENARRIHEETSK